MPTTSQLQSAFNEGVRLTTDSVRYGALRDAIARNDYQGALNAIDIDDAAFDKLRVAILNTYAQGGVDAIAGTKWPVATRWNSSTPQMERFARDVVGEQIKYITDDMRAAVRWTMGDSIALGRSNNRTALDIAGRIGKSGSREGGILGLNEQQSKWVQNMRRTLESDPASLLGHPKLGTQFNTALRSGNLSAAQIDRITQTYSNRLLLARGLTIAKTERGLAVNMGMYEGYRQAAEKSGIPLLALRKEWQHVGAHVHERVTHVAASGEVVQGLDTPFMVGVHPMMYPHDPNAPASEVINCSCRMRVRVPKNWRAYG